MNDAPQWSKIYKCLPIGHVNSYWIKSYTSEKKTNLKSYAFTKHLLLIEHIAKTFEK